jgi:uncharacterized phosphosugar-binding protein
MTLVLMVTTWLWRISKKGLPVSADPLDALSDAAEEYVMAARELLGNVMSSQRESIAAAAQAIALSLRSGGTLHAFGTGHSHILAEELFYRAGGLVSVNPILFDGLMLHRDPMLSTQLERLSGLAEALLGSQKIASNDVAIVASNSGANAVVCEVAREMQKRGVVVIALTSLHHATSNEARGAAGTRLHDFADIVIDNGGVLGDASLSIPGFQQKVAPTSTVVGAAIVNALVAQTVANMVTAGYQPEVYTSSNTEGGDAANAQLHPAPTSRGRAL